MQRYEIPYSEITPFEDSVMNYILLLYLDIRHYELFGLSGKQKMTEEERFELYPSLTGEQINILKRDVLVNVLSQTSGVNKKSYLLLELVKYHFPEEMASIENTHNEEYMKKHLAIQEKIDEINSENEELKEIA